jgi:hypothetical protein
MPARSRHGGGLACNEHAAPANPRRPRLASPHVRCFCRRGNVACELRVDRRDGGAGKPGPTSNRVVAGPGSRALRRTGWWRGRKTGPRVDGAGPENRAPRRTASWRGREAGPRVEPRDGGAGKPGPGGELRGGGAGKPGPASNRVVAGPENRAPRGRDGAGRAGHGWKRVRGGRRRDKRRTRGASSRGPGTSVPPEAGSHARRIRGSSSQGPGGGV